MRKKLVSTIVAALFIVGLAILPNAIGVVAIPSMYVEPAIVCDTSLVPGTEFTVDITVDYVEYLWCLQFKMGDADFEIPGWDPAILQLVGIELGEFLIDLPRPGAICELVIPEDALNNEEGTLGLSAAIISPRHKRYCPVGGGVMLTLTFEVVGYGCSVIHFGLDTGMLDPAGLWLMRGTMNPGAIHNGFFCNIEGPELYIRTKGAHGGGVWPDWQVNSVDVPQTLYSRIASHGTEGSWVKVQFTVVSTFPTQTYFSNEAWVDAKTGEDPELATVSKTFTPQGPAKYHVSGMLFFKTADMTAFVPYQLLVDAGREGIAVTRDVAEHYKVVD